MWSTILLKDSLFYSHSSQGHTHISLLTPDDPALTVNKFFTLKFVDLLYGDFLFDLRRKLNLYNATVYTNFCLHNMSNSSIHTLKHMLHSQECVT